MEGRNSHSLAERQSSPADVGGRVQRLVSYFPLDHKIIDCPLLKNSDWIRK
jgi:hypothetical protein